MRTLVLFLGLSLVLVNLLTTDQGRSLLGLLGQVKVPQPAGGLPGPVQQGLPPASPAPTRPGVVGGSGGGQAQP